MTESAGAPLVLVLPLGVRSAPWACRSLRKRGYRVLGAHAGPRWRARTRHCPELVPLPPPESDGFADAVERLCRARGVAVILPLSDATVRALAAQPPTDTVVAGPDATQVARLMDKAELPRAAAAAGLASPAAATGAPWPPLPSIVKRRLPGGSGPLTALAETEEEREAAVEALRAAGAEPLVQEQTRGRSWQLEFLRTPDELRWIALDTLHRYPAATGSSSLAVTAAPPSGLVDASAQLLAEAGYLGAGEIEAIARDGELVLHDVNLRLSASVGAAMAAGLDLPALAVDVALGRPLAPAGPLRRTVYASLEGEGARLAAALRGAPGAEPALRVVRSLAAAALLPGRVLDPLEPRRVAAALAAALDRRRGRTAEHAARYWDGVVGGWAERAHDRVWRMHCDALNAQLLDDWLGTRAPGRVLKTDLFEEAVGAGLVHDLEARGARISGIDVSPLAVQAAAGRHPALDAHEADVRALPFADGSFDTVVSTSTLDHFASLTDVARALRELRRVLAPGGELLLTLDNGANPVVAARAVLPHALLRRLRLAPYRAGATCGPERLAALVRGAGFELVEERAVMHCPRALAVPLASRVAPARAAGFLRVLAGFERLGRLPTRWLTGYYVAVRARAS
jgi:SAM-dependent methyltransferase